MATSKLCCNTYIPSYKTCSILIHLSFAQISVADLTGNRLDWKLLYFQTLQLSSTWQSFGARNGQRMADCKKLSTHAVSDYIQKPLAQTIWRSVAYHTASSAWNHDDLSLLVTEEFKSKLSVCKSNFLVSGLKCGCLNLQWVRRLSLRVYVARHSGHSNLPGKWTW